MFRNLSLGAIGVKVPIDVGCRLAEQSRFAGIDLSVGHVHEAGSVEKLKELLDRCGLRAGGFSFPASWFGPAEAWKASLQRLPSYLEQGRALGASVTTVVIRSWSETLPYKENFAFHVERLRPGAEILAEYGFRWGFEFLGPKTLRAGKPHEFLYTAEACLELCAAVGPNAGLLLDSWHWYTSGGTLEQLRQIPGEKIVYVHVNDAPAGIPRDEQIDNVRCLPGETGVIDLVGMMQVLREKGCEAPVTVEPFSARVRAMAPEEAVKVTADSLLELWQRAGLRE